MINPLFFLGMLMGIIPWGILIKPYGIYIQITGALILIVNFVVGVLLKK